MRAQVSIWHYRVSCTRKKKSHITKLTSKIKSRINMCQLDIIKLIRSRQRVNVCLYVCVSVYILRMRATEFIRKTAQRSHRRIYSFTLRTLHVKFDWQLYISFSFLPNRPNLKTQWWCCCQRNVSLVPHRFLPPSVRFCYRVWQSNTHTFCLYYMLYGWKRVTYVSWNLILWPNFRRRVRSFDFL
jgi:hypothetical protein